MDKLIKRKMTNVLKATAESIMKDQKEDGKIRLERMDTVINLQKIIDNYDELEPVLKKFFAEKARKEKFKGIDESR